MDHLQIYTMACSIRVGHNYRHIAVRTGRICVWKGWIWFVSWCWWLVLLPSHAMGRMPKVWTRLVLFKRTALSQHLFEMFYIHQNEIYVSITRNPLGSFNVKGCPRASESPKTERSAFVCETVFSPKFSAHGRRYWKGIGTFAARFYIIFLCVYRYRLKIT